MRVFNSFSHGGNIDKRMKGTFARFMENVILKIEARASYARTYGMRSGLISNNFLKYSDRADISRITFASQLIGDRDERNRR